jgi:hypothetical protein
MDAPSQLERYITILVIPVIGLAIVFLPFIVCALYVVVTAAALGLRREGIRYGYAPERSRPRHYHIYHVHEPALGLRCSGGINTSFRLLKEPPGVGPPLMTWIRPSTTADPSPWRPVGIGAIVCQASRTGL